MTRPTHASPYRRADSTRTYCFVFPRVTILSSSRWLPAIKSPRVSPSSSLATLDWRVERARLDGADKDVEDDASDEEADTEGAGEAAGDEGEGDEVDEVVAIARPSERGTAYHESPGEPVGKGQQPANGPP